MTKKLQKRWERIFLNEAIARSKFQWTIVEEREGPDFIVEHAGGRFGLEVVDVFAGKVDGAGSVLRRKEGINEQKVAALRREYEANTGVGIQVQFIGPLSDYRASQVVERLIAEDFANKPLAEPNVILLDDGWMHPKLKLIVRRWDRPDWYIVNDRVGWVDMRPNLAINCAIRKKTRRLKEYQTAVGPDVRLLLVADGMKASGKIRLPAGSAFYLRGFNAAYLYCRPEYLIPLTSRTSTSAK